MNDELLKIRFTGPSLDNRSLPIYELGTALIAIQRIVHKTHLFEKGRLEKGARLPAGERETVALQISSHQKGSDVWNLAPYLSNSAYGPIIQGLVVAGLSAIAAYVWKRVSRRDDPPPNQILIVNVFPEIRSLTDRIGNIGGVEGIEISSTQAPDIAPLLISNETQDYIRQIEHDKFPGKKCTVTGMVTRLYPQSFRLDIEDDSGEYIHVTMLPELFEKVRLMPNLIGKKITVEGVPYYKLGDIGSHFEDFEAERIVPS